MHAGNSLAVKETQAPKVRKVQTTGAKKGGMDLD